MLYISPLKALVYDVERNLRTPLAGIQRTAERRGEGGAAFHGVPRVDVRTGGPVGMVSSQLIAPGLTMIGPRAGLRRVDHVPAYLNNLNRLGLVWFSRESLRDPMDYQVVEAQPDVLAAMHSVKFAKVVRRSIHLTPFGEDFGKSCLIEEEKADADFPAHLAPPAGETSDPA